MNCVKCNASIPEAKSFCPICGHFNEAAKTGVPKSRLHLRLIEIFLHLSGPYYLLFPLSCRFINFNPQKILIQHLGFPR